MSEHTEDNHVEEINPIEQPDEQHFEQPEEEHPVLLAVKQHLFEMIAEGLANVPPEIEADFAAILNHVKSYI
jgi:hypothetical protein